MASLEQRGVQSRECPQRSVQVGAGFRVYSLELHSFEPVVVVFKADDKLILVRKFRMLREPCEDGHRALSGAKSHNFISNHRFGHEVVLLVQPVVGRDYLLRCWQPTARYIGQLTLQETLDRQQLAEYAWRVVQDHTVVHHELQIIQQAANLLGSLLITLCSSLFHSSSQIAPLRSISGRYYLSPANIYRRA